MKSPEFGAFFILLKMHFIYLFFCIFFSLYTYGQTSWPNERFSAWQNSGCQHQFDSLFVDINMADYNIDATGQADCSAILQSVLNQYDHVRIQFNAGTFKIEQPIVLKSHQVLAGAGPDLTHFIVDLNGAGHAFSASGTIEQQYYSVNAPLVKNQNFVVCTQQNFDVGNWLYLQNADSALVTSTWALGSTGQMIQIDHISGDTLWLEKPLRRSYSGETWVRKMNPLTEIGLRCFSIERQDDTAPIQTSNIRFFGLVEAQVESIYSNKCNFAHLELTSCAHVTVRKCFYNEGFTYGGGGRAYGVVLQQTSGDNLIEDNIFKHLRHSVLFQSGANGNVCAFNFSTDAYWEESLLTANAAGEIVLHGNYPYSNLIEQNSVGNIVIDNSHGANGPDNLFYRNRATLYGIFFSDQSSPNQLFIGNHVTNTNFPYNFVNWTISGTGHFLFANNNKGNIVPSNTSFVSDTSFAYTEKPSFVNLGVWLHIGDQPAIILPIPAENRWLNQAYFSTSCNQTDLSLYDPKLTFLSYPNPVQGQLSITCSKPYFGNVFLFNSAGQILGKYLMHGSEMHINTEEFKEGVYLLNFEQSNGVLKMIKIN
jgi:hypothetical protein